MPMHKKKSSTGRRRPASMERNFTSSSGNRSRRIAIPRRVATAREQRRSIAALAAERAEGAAKPRWDDRARELWYGSTLVKRFRSRAKNSDKILAAFEEDGWPRAIDDPLPFDPTIDPKARLKRAIHHLNSAQENPALRFHGNGNGDGIRWEYVKLDPRQD
jgi:hypothetical protein